MDFTLILFLIGLNALFALSEMSVIASRSARLQQFEDEARPGAAAAAMLQGMTAHYLCTSTFPLAAGHTCLVHAAAGGVGDERGRAHRVQGDLDGRRRLR